MGIKRDSNFVILLLGIFTVMSLSMDLAMVTDETVGMVSGDLGRLTGILVKLACSVGDYSIAGILAVFFCFVLYRYSFEIGKIKIYELVLGVLMALTFLFGRAFDEFGSPQILVTGVAQVVKSFLILAGGILCFSQSIKAVVSNLGENVSISGGFDVEDAARYRRLMFAFIVMAWSITYIAFFPGLFQGDTDDIIYMSYNYHTALADTVVRIDESSMWVDHHSVFYTVILGAFVKAARILHVGDNAGIAIYTTLQGLFSAWVLAYSLYKLKKVGVHPAIRSCIAVFFAFFPWIPRYALMATKDTLFADFLVLYLLTVADIVQEEDDKIETDRLVRLVIYAVVMFLLRKNGLYVSLLSLPFLVMLNRKWVKYLAIAFLSIYAVKSAYSHVLLPALHITDGSMNAALTIPLQQTSRYIHYFPDDVTDEERQAVDMVVNYELLSADYQPQQADYVRSCWRKEADMGDLAAYMKAWVTMLIKHPLTYVAATAHGNYAHFYPVVMELSYFEASSVGSYQTSGRDDYFDFHHVENAFTMTFRKLLRVTDKLFERLPVVSLMCTSALYIWGLIFVWTGSIVCRDRKLLMLVIPLLMLMLTIVSGPCNGNVYPRFTYPVAMCVPIVAAFGFRKQSM